MVDFLPYCPVCFGPPVADDACCVDCRDELTRCLRELPLDWLPVAAGGGYRRTALYHYEGSFRRLLLRVKVEGDLVALALLTSLALARPESAALAGWAEVVVAAPSSLWGRLRGRVDACHAVAAALAEAHGRPLAGAPWQLHWRTRKRAQIARGARIVSPEDPGRWGAALARGWLERRGPRLAGRRVLLVDDVSTSGMTLLETAAALARAGPEEIRLLALAVPRR
jgi:predicted amidophosphoribosyltransferase